MLKRILMFSLVASTLSFAGNSVDLKTIQELPIFKGNGAKIISGQEYSKYIQLKGVAQSPQGPMPFTAFLIKGTSDVVFGSGFNAKTGKPITLTLDMQKYETSAMFKLGNGKEKIYIFTDPECPFCIKLEGELTKLSEGRTIYVFPFPLSMHENAMGMTYYVLSQKTDLERRDALTFVSQGERSQVLRVIEEFNIGKYQKPLAAELGDRLAKIQKENQDPSKLSEENKKFVANAYAILKSFQSGKFIYEAVQSSIKSGILDSSDRLEDAKKIVSILEKVQKLGYHKSLLKSQEIAESIGISGTPNVFNAKGENVNWMELLNISKTKKGQ